MFTRTVTALALVALSAVGTSAQVPTQNAPAQTPSTKGVVLKGRAPVSNDILKVTLPRAQQADLVNGVHLIVLEDHRVPQISIRLDIRGAGGYFDPADMPGVATVVAAMLSEGTKTRTSQQIAEQLETLAASVNINSDMAFESTGVTASCLVDNLDQVLDLAADILLNPSFPEQELARYKLRTKAMLMQQRANPGALANEMFSRLVYGGHPAGRTLTAANVDTITRDALVAFHAARYAPDHAVIGVVGDTTLKEIKAKLDTKLAAWTKKGLAKPDVADPEAISAGKVSLVDRANSVQTNLIVGTQAIPRTSSDYDVLSVTNAIIGGGPTGRLFLNLREEKGYTYGAYSRMSTPRYRGDWGASTQVRTDVTEPALTEILKEVARLRDERIPDKEFQDKKRSLVANFALSLETPSAILGNYVTSWAYGMPADYWDKYPERIMAITQDQIQAAARKYFDSTRLQIVAVGDGKKIGEGLKKFGTLDIYDTDGKLVGGR
ncbi:MAG TPA: pitrilysin family protein [Vicinamibacterales bacterium]|jgi:zinc protease